MFYARYIKDEGYKDVPMRIFLDIGFAYMEYLTYFVLGFRNLVGVESSKAQVVVDSQGYDLNIISGDFENSLVQDQIRKVGHVQIYLAHHVLEQTTEPDN